MQNRRLNSVIVKFALLCRVVILFLLATGVIVSGTHSHIAASLNSHGTSSYGGFSSDDTLDSAVIASSSCPSHLSCHQQVFYSKGTDLALLSPQDSSLRHRPRDTTVMGRSMSLDHPPPKA